MNKTQTAKTLVESVVRRMIGLMILHPGNLELNVVPGEMIVSVKIRAHLADTGRIVGQGGANFKPMSTLLGMIGEKLGVKVNLKRIADPVVGQKEFHKFTPRADWKREEISALIFTLCVAVFEEPIEVTAIDQSDGVTTLFMIKLSGHEKTAKVASFFECLDPLLNSIGMANGRILELDIRHDPTGAEPVQPEAADGRYAVAAER